MQWSAAAGAAVVGLAVNGARRLRVRDVSDVGRRRTTSSVARRWIASIGRTHTSRGVSATSDLADIREDKVVYVPDRVAKSAGFSPGSRRMKTLKPSLLTYG